MTELLRAARSNPKQKDRRSSPSTTSELGAASMIILLRKTGWDEPRTRIYPAHPIHIPGGTAQQQKRSVERPQRQPRKSVPGQGLPAEESDETPAAPRGNSYAGQNIRQPDDSEQERVLHRWIGLRGRRDALDAMECSNAADQLPELLPWAGLGGANTTAAGNKLQRPPRIATNKPQYAGFLVPCLH